MSNTESQTVTTPTKVTNPNKKKEHPIMSFTAVTSRQDMAEAFTSELVKTAKAILTEEKLSINDLISIFNLAQNKNSSGATKVEGKHLRARISDQLSRADRYGENFSIMAIFISKNEKNDAYELMVDTLSERMRNTDLLFMFKFTIILLLPHTDSDACLKFVKRINKLVTSVANLSMPKLEHITYPCDDLESRSSVLDWTEDQLRP